MNAPATVIVRASSHELAVTYALATLAVLRRCHPQWPALRVRKRDGYWTVFGSGGELP